MEKNGFVLYNINIMVYHTVILDFCPVEFYPAFLTITADFIKIAPIIIFY